MMDQQDDDIVSLPEDRKDDRRYPARSRSPVRLYKPPRDSVGQPDFLNESTLIALSTYLLTHRDRLDEDELTNHMVHIDAVTTDRMRYSDFGNDSDEEEGLEDIYRQEEDSVLAQDFFKQAVTIAQEAAPLDKRTINWIRKEMGFVKKKDEILAKSSVAKAKDHNTDESEDSGEQPQMRLTRTQARNTRVKKREERSAKDNQGLQDLFAAVNELELDLGRPFGHADADTKRKIGSIDAETNNTPPNKKKRASKKGMLLQESTDTEEGSGLVALMRKSRTPIKVTKVLVEGTDVNYEFEKDPMTPKRKRRAPTDGSSIKKRRTKYLASPKTPSFRTPQSKPKSSRKIKTPMSEKARPPQKHASETPISLSLLEWRRRHQWTPSKEQRAAAAKLKDRIEDDDDDELQPRMLDDEVPAITIPVTYKDEGIDLRLPPWELCNPVAQIAVGEPPVTEPERLVYTNDKYASWCTKMINSLTGSARSWARYEFFYSDIDRPWFNFNEFHIELAKHGVSPSAKLTRREWSAVREAIRGRPRRFSRKFISTEMNKLNSYRHLVRMMQHSGLPRPPNFGYEVYPPIKVGHIVTAYNRRFRILQRGTVLTYDSNRKMYLIQFERKEVGFEFVLDIDVAAHGVPELIYGASEVALDETLLGGFANRNNEIGSMLYGTLYGRNTFHSVRQQPMIRGLAIRDNDSVVRLYGESMASSALPENTYLRPFLNANLVEKVAEREIVTKLIEFIDKALKRKMILLEAIDTLNQRVTGSYAMDPSGYSRLSPDFQHHYAWLMANFEITTECLDSLMIHLQVMYGRGYAGRGGALYDLPNGRTATEKALAKFNETQPLDPSLCAPWVGALSSASKAAALMLPMSHAQLAPGLSHLEQQRELAMQSRLRAAGQLLLASTYTIALAGNLDHGTDIGTPGAANVALMDQHEQLTKVPLPFYTTDSKTALQAVNDRRAVAINELEEAIESLSSEVAAKHALDCLQSKHRATFAAAS